MLLHTILLFFISVILALVWAMRAASYIPDNTLHTSLFEPWRIALYILIGTAVILLISKFFVRIRSISLRALFIIALFGGTQVFLGAFFSFYMSFIIALFLLLYRIVRPSIFAHNILIIFACAGVAGVLGISVTVESAVLLLIILSVYDVIAVYQTRHMVYLATHMIASQAFLGFIIPESLVSYTTKISQARVNEGFMFLGGGDIVLPSVFAVSALSVNVLASLFVIIGAVCAIVVNHYILIKTNRPLPALPLMACGMIIFFYFYTMFLF